LEVRRKYAKKKGGGTIGGGKSKRVIAIYRDF
jgi:hypothetical protein